MSKTIARLLTTHKLAINVLLFAVVGLVFLMVDTGKAHAVELSDIPGDIKTDLAKFDGTNVPPNQDCIRNGTPYYQADEDWLYPDGSPADDGGYYTSANPLQLTSGETITLDIQLMTFLCHYSINPENVFSNNDQAMDGDPYTTDGTAATSLVRNSQIWLAEQTKYVFGDITVSGGGSIVTPPTPGTTDQTVEFTQGTRYWEPSPTAITYKAPSPTTTTTYDLTVTAKLYPANWFEESGAPPYVCVNNNSTNWYDSSDFNGTTGDSYIYNHCNASTTTFTMSVKVSPNICTESCSPCSSSCPPHTPPSANCPNQPPGSTTPSIKLPPGDTPAKDSGTSQQSGASTSPGSTYYQDIPNGEYDIISAYDQFTPSTPITWSPTGYQDSSSFTLNYANYVTQYPYDLHTTTVNYMEEYTQTIWQTRTSPSYYTCPSGGSLSGSTCTITVVSPAQAHCTTKKGKTTCTYSCSSGTLSGESCISTSTYRATAWYDWYSSSTSPVNGQSTTNSNAAPALGECYARTFSLQPAITNVTVGSSSSSDVPGSVMVNGGVNATFGLDGPSGTWHALCQVNGISTTVAVYYTTPGDANPQPLPGGSDTYTRTYASSPSNCNGAAPTTLISASFPTDIPPLAYGDTVCAYISVTPSDGFMDYNGNITDESGNPSGGDGDTTIAPSNAPYSFTSSSCSATPIGAEPYFKAFGGDVMAGTDSDYISGCYDNSAGIYSWSEAGNGSIGAGTTGAALATGNVSQFASGQNILSMLDPPPLTFANYQPTEYGGDYGEGGNCGAPDYYTLAQSIPGAVSCPSEIDSATLAQQGVTFVNPLSPTISVGQNDHYICYSLNKNVTIASNITYSPPPPNTPANELPVFEVIVKGANIYIDTPFNQSSDTPTPGQPVTELFGNYIAEINNGQGGTIDDTAQGSAAGTVDICSPDASGSSNDYDNTCTQDRLVIDGSFIANQIDLYRSYGTLHDANTVSTYSPSSCSDSGGGDCYDAEEFDFGPINWLTPGNAELTIQSITSLPPVL